MVTGRVLPLLQGWVRLDGLSDLPEVRGLFLGDADLIRALGLQQQETVDQCSGLDVCQGRMVSNIVAIASVLGEVGLVQAHELGDNFGVKLVGFLDSVLDGPAGSIQDLGAKHHHGSISRVEKLVDLVLLPCVLAHQVEFLGQVTFNGLSFREFEDRAIGGRLIDDGEALEGSLGLLSGPVLDEQENAEGERGERRRREKLNYIRHTAHVPQRVLSLG